MKAIGCHDARNVVISCHVVVISLDVGVIARFGCHFLHCRYWALIAAIKVRFPRYQFAAA